MARSDAIRQLVELGLSAAPAAAAQGSAGRDPVEIEILAVRQMDQLLDPRIPRQKSFKASRRAQQCLVDREGKRGCETFLGARDPAGEGLLPTTRRSWLSREADAPRLGYSAEYSGFG